MHTMLGRPFRERPCPDCNGWGEKTGVPHLPKQQVIGLEPLTRWVFCERCLGTGILVQRTILFSENEFSEGNIVIIKTIEVPKANL